MFRKISANGFAQCGWHSPEGVFYPAPSFLHDAVASMLYEKHHGVPAAPSEAVDLLLEKGWVRASCDGYYEVARFEGSARTVVLDLVVVLPPKAEVVLDVTETRRSISGLTAEQFYDKYL
jgi:hypothetical protein